MKKFATLVGAGIAAASLTFAGPAFAASGHADSGSGHSQVGAAPAAGVAGEPAPAAETQSGSQRIGMELPIAPIGESSQTHLPQ